MQSLRPSRLTRTDRLMAEHGAELLIPALRRLVAPARSGGRPSDDCPADAQYADDGPQVGNPLPTVAERGKEGAGV